MASLAMKYATKKILDKETRKNKKKKVHGSDNPLFEMIPVPGKPGKMMKVKKQIPDYIPDHDAMILAKARKSAYYLDMSFSFFGIPLGFSSIVGIIPGFGDVLDAIIALYVYWLCSKVECKLDLWTHFWMVLNIGVDFLVGLIPFAGDLGDAYFRCNTKNVQLLSKRLDEIYMPEDLKKRKRKGERPPIWHRWRNDANSDPKTAFTRPGREREDRNAWSPATVYEELSDDDSPGLPTVNSSQQPMGPGSSLRRT